MIMFSYRSCLVLLVLVSTNAVQGFRMFAKEKSCDLECPRNAPCRFGKADFSGRTGILASENETHQNGMHCDCPIGEYYFKQQCAFSFLVMMDFDY